MNLIADVSCNDAPFNDCTNVTCRHYVLGSPLLTVNYTVSLGRWGPNTPFLPATAMPSSVVHCECQDKCKQGVLTSKGIPNLKGVPLRSTSCLLMIHQMHANTALGGARGLGLVEQNKIRCKHNGSDVCVGDGQSLRGFRRHMIS